MPTLRVARAMAAKRAYHADRLVRFRASGEQSSLNSGADQREGRGGDRPSP